MTPKADHHWRGADLAMSGRLPSLDGVRAVAVCLVVLWHFSRTPGMGAWLPLRSLGDGGTLGVRVFFVLSGFLITTLILREEIATGRFSLRAFYLRRARRILPAFVMFLLGVAVLDWSGLVSPSRADMWHAVTLTMNYHPHRDWTLGHLWSLSVEEQFYLLWPLCMVVVKRNRVVVLLAVLAFAPLCRVGTLALFPSQEPMIGEAFPTIMDAVATGCLFACLRSSLESKVRYMRALQSPMIWMLIPLIFLTNARLHWFLSLVAGESAINIAIAALIHRVLVCPNDAVGRLLNARPVAYVGRASYSLYLWQQPFLTSTGPLQWVPPPLKLVLAATSAWLSFSFVEMPFRTGPMTTIGFPGTSLNSPSSRPSAPQTPPR